MDAVIITNPGLLLRSRQRIIVLVALTGLMHCASSGLSQQPDQADGGVRLQTTSIGIGRYAPGKWGVRGVEISNSTDESVEVRPDVIFGADSLMDYARRTWMPPHSRRRVAIPIQASQDESNQIQARTNLSAGSSSTPSNPAAESLARAQPPLTVLLSDREISEEAVLSDVREMVVAMRLSAGGTRNLSEFSSDEIASFELGLDAADEIVLVGNQLTDLPAALTTLGVWLQRVVLRRGVAVVWTAVAAEALRTRTRVAS